MRSLDTAPATAERAGPPAATTRAAAPSAISGHCGESRAPAERAGPPRRPRAPQPLLQSLDSAPATAERAGPPAATTRAAAPSAVSRDCGESRAPAERAGPPAATTRAAAPSAVSGHCGESRAPSGDHARRSPFCSLWTLRRPLRREPGPQRRPRAPQPLLQSLDTAERAGPPAATTRAAAPSAVSGHCAGHCGESRAPSGDHARRSPFCSLWTLRREPGHCGESRAPSGDHARRSPFCSLWTLRREPGPQRRPRAPQPLLQSLDTAERAGPPTATTRAAAPSAVSGHCAGHCGESRAPSGDHARRSPFCSLWTLRREPGPQRRPRAPQPLLQSLDTAEKAGPPAATTRAAAPSAVSGHCGESRAPSGDHARRSPFCSLWTLRREPGPQRRPRAPQPLLQSLDTAERAGPPAATTRAAAPSAVSGHCGESRVPSGDHPRRSPFCSLWTLRREPGPQRRPRAPQPLLQSLDTAPSGYVR